MSTINPNAESRVPENMYTLGKILGNGSFGVVCEAIHNETAEKFAIKKVLQDPRYKNRELDVMKELKHPNVIKLVDYFYTISNDDTNLESSDSRNFRGPNRYLNVVMEYIPETVYRVAKSFKKNGQQVPMIVVKLYIYQLCRAVGYLHSIGICHRDIKPQNLLVDSKTHILKLCDFGSAKRLIPTEPSVAYICSRFYRAPELMLGATEYTTAIDMWSVGCVLGELLLGQPLFSGETSIDQLVKIIQVLGTPASEQMIAMNPHYTDVRFPTVKPREWKKVLPISTPNEAIDLISKLLRYEPNLRIKPYEALGHCFFDELRQSSISLSNGYKLPPLFNFNSHEESIIPQELLMAIIPERAN